MTGFDQLTRALAGRYAIERELGAGEMATVYLAEDLKLHRQVAVKVLRPELAATLGPNRFLQEIDIAAQLHHPHILGLYDSGEAEGFLYYVMPSVEGESLRDKLAREGELPIPETIRIMREVVDALSYAHARNVVHRDIKPDNVMVSGRHVLVMDFGIAKAVSEATGLNRMTTAGVALGTPSYMAPEQAAADPHVDHRADIYAVGAMAFEMLAGRPPFTGETHQAILAAQLTETAEPVTTFREAVPPMLAEFVAKCLEKKPADRFQSAEEMLLLLDAIATPSIGMTPTGVATSPRPRVSRRLMVGLAAVIAVTALAGYRFVRSGGSGTLIGEEILAENDLILVAEFENRTADSLLGATITDAIRVELQQSRVVAVLGQQEMWDGIRRMGLQPGIEFPDSLNRQLAQREGAKAFVTGEVSRLGAGYQLTARVNATVDGAEVLTALTTASDDAELIGAVEDLGRQLRTDIGESLRSVRAAEPLARVTTASLPALRAYMAAGRAQRAGQGVPAVQLAEEAVSIDSAFASAWALLNVIWSNAGLYREAATAQEQAYRFRDRLAEGQRSRLMARYYADRGEYALAEESHRESIRLGGGVGATIGYADFLLEQGRWPEAEEQSLEGARLDPDSWVAFWNAVEAQVVQRRYEAADSTIAEMARALPDLNFSVQLQAREAVARRDFDEAQPIIQSLDGPLWRALACRMTLHRGRLQEFERCPGPPADNPLAIGAWLDAALAEIRYTGDPNRARRIVDTELESERDASYPYPELIQVAAETGRAEEARRLLAEWRALVGEDDPLYRMDVGRAEGALALAEGQPDRAVRAYLDWNQSGFVTATHIYNRGMAEAANAHDRAGRPDSAIVWYERALNTPSIFGIFYEVGWYAPALRRLGELHESLGHRDEAIGYFQQFIELWKDADDELQPQVEQARGRLARLVGETRN